MLYFSDIPIKPSQYRNSQIDKIESFKESYKEMGIYSIHKNLKEFRDRISQDLNDFVVKYYNKLDREFQNFQITDVKGDIIGVTDVKGDIIGVGVSNSNNIIGKNIIISSDTIKVNKQELAKVDSKYANALQEFSYKLNQELKGREMPEDQIHEINNRLNELAKEIKGVKAEEEQKINYEKQKSSEAKTDDLIQIVSEIMPQQAKTATTFTPLAPISKLIGKSVEHLVDEISKRMKS